MTIIERLESEFASLQEEERRIVKRKRAVAMQINAIRAAERPEFPTEEQRQGLAEACRRITNSEEPKSHLGDPTPTYAVKVDGVRGWISIEDGAPYGFRGYGQEKLWMFTDQEIAAFKRILLDLGFRVADEWRHGDGVSLIVKAI